MDIILPFYYAVIPAFVTYRFVFDFCGWSFTGGDINGIFELSVPFAILVCVHVASLRHWSFIAVVMIAELVFLVVAHKRKLTETERLDDDKAAFERALHRIREEFAARVNLRPSDPIIDGAFAVLTQEARDSIRTREELAALLAEHATENQKVLRRNRLFKK